MAFNDRVGYSSFHEMIYTHIKIHYMSIAPKGGLSFRQGADFRNQVVVAGRYRPVIMIRAGGWPCRSTTSTFSLLSILAVD